MIKCAINGFGRIGRNVLRALLALESTEISIVAINDLGDIKTLAHLLQYDSTHGTLAQKVEVSGDCINVAGQTIKVLSERSAANLPWQALKIDLVLECSGHYCSKTKAQAHLQAGAKKVLISAPAGNDVCTIVYGVNEESLKPDEVIVSNASCTTNCLAPMLKPLHDKLVIKQGLMTTIHAYTNDQVLLDVYHEDLRRARSATQSMIPTKTGAASAIGLVIPSLKGKLDGSAIRVPTKNVSFIELNLICQSQTTLEEIHALYQAAAAKTPKVLVLNHEPLVSVDFNHHPASCILDCTQTKIQGELIKVCAWYDNEWGFSNRMLDLAALMMQ